MKEVWIAGELHSPDSEYGWGVIGVFTSEGKAVAACYHTWCFVAKVALDSSAPESRSGVPFPEGYYPLLEGGKNGKD